MVGAPDPDPRAASKPECLQRADGLSNVAPEAPVSYRMAIVDKGDGFRPLGGMELDIVQCHRYGSCEARARIRSVRRSIGRSFVRLSDEQDADERDRGHRDDVEADRPGLASELLQQA